MKNKINLILLLCLIIGTATGQVRLNGVIRDTVKVSPNFTVNIKDVKNHVPTRMRMLLNEAGGVIDTNRLNSFNLSISGTYYLTCYEKNSSIYAKKFYIVLNITARPNITLCNTDSARLYCNTSGDVVEWFKDGDYITAAPPTDTITVFENGAYTARVLDGLNNYPISLPRNVNCIIAPRKK